MKVCRLGLLLVGVLAASQVSAAEPNQASLEAMGLAGIRVMSDSEGLAVRGFGYRGGATANGKSWASVSVPGANAGSVNSYSASGKKVAFGASGSIGAVIIETENGHGGGHGGGGGGYKQSSKGGHGGGGSKPKSVSVVAIGGGFSVGKTK